MDALILSCGTGGGHNAAGTAVKQELESRGHHAVMLDPYDLVSHKLAIKVGKTYIRIAQCLPRVFGFIYLLGALVRRLPGKSPVYYANIPVAKRLMAYLEDHSFDVIIMPHLFPAEMVTYLKRLGIKLPLMVFVATDYECIPFTEETECDYYVVPGKAQIDAFVRRGISNKSIRPLGIPVSGAFGKNIDRRKAREYLGLDSDTFYVLVTGGSIGAGNIEKTIRYLTIWMEEKQPGGKIIVVCGNNDRLYNRLKQKNTERLLLIRRTDRMALYMRACNVFISKPGGLSSTEAATVGVPFIQTAPIPGCESKNMRYFSEKGMSLAVRHPSRQLANAMDQLCVQENAERMFQKQREGIPKEAGKRICDWLEMLIQGGFDG